MAPASTLRNKAETCRSLCVTLVTNGPFAYSPKWSGENLAKAQEVERRLEIQDAPPYSRRISCDAFQPLSSLRKDARPAAFNKD
jgi:hypothetical protein